MQLEETINKFIRDVVNNILGVSNTIKANQNAPRPDGCYADVNFITDVSIGWEQTELVNQSNTELEATVMGQREIMMAVGFYRSGAKNMARTVRTALVHPTYELLFNRANIGLTRRSDIRAVSETYENGWEERSQFDIFLNVVGSYSDIINTITSVNIAGESQTNNKPYNFNVII